MSKTPIAIYFDLGNVLLTFDHLRACSQIAVTCGLTTDRVRACLFEGDGLQLAYERGEVTSKEFCDRFRSHVDAIVADEELLLAGSDMFAQNTAILPIAAHLNSSGYDLGILSNTCEAHWQFVTDGKYDVLELFRGPVVLSYEVRSMKPDPAIYRAAIDAVDCEPAEIFFTDDRPENVEAAREAGMDAVIFSSVEQLASEFSRRGIEIRL